MKTIRIWFLLLLAALLPIRGAMAAAMLCPPAGVGTQSELRVGGHPVGHHATVESATVHDHDAHDHAAHGHGAPAQAVDVSLDAQPAGAADSQADECGLCSAFCSVTSLLSSIPTVQAPALVELTVFPALSAPAPSFLSDGQDRPPRSI